MYGGIRCVWGERRRQLDQWMEAAIEGMFKRGLVQSQIEMEFERVFRVKVCKLAVLFSVDPGSTFRRNWLKTGQSGLSTREECWRMTMRLYRYIWIHSEGPH